jgi:hypothetical protein
MRKKYSSKKSSFPWCLPACPEPCWFRACRLSLHCRRMRYLKKISKILIRLQKLLFCKSVENLSFKDLRYKHYLHYFFGYLGWATPSVGFPKEAVSRLRRGLFFSYIGLSFDDDRTAHRGMVKAITVSRLQVVHSQGSADPWVVGHCCCVCNKRLAASLLHGIHKCRYNDWS